MKKCLECGSVRIIVNAEIVESAREASEFPLRVRVDAAPNAVFFKETVYSDVRADICADCGYMALHTLEPKKLADAYQKAQKGIS